MFPLLRDRAARAIDLAIEFATLGEYRLADAVAPAGPASLGARRVEPAGRRQGAPARPAAAVRPAPAARVVVPATPAGRLAQAAAAAPPRPPHADRSRVRPTPLVPGAAFEQLALTLEGPVASPPKRTRGGAAPPPPQPCESPRR